MSERKPVRLLADYKSAIRQISNLRYDWAPSLHRENTRDAPMRLGTKNFMHTLISLCVGAAGALSLTGCHTTLQKGSASQAVRVLEKELRDNTGWIQIHAADALLDHGYSDVVLEVLGPLAENPPTQFRTGIWRALARARKGEASERLKDKLRKTVTDEKAADRLQATESLAKLGDNAVACKMTLQKWLGEAPEAVAPYPHWLLYLSSQGAEKDAHEEALATLLDSDDPVARTRAAYALGRFETLAPETLLRIVRRVEIEPAGTIARPYLLSALLRQASREDWASAARVALLPYLENGDGGQKLEAATVLGMRGTDAGVRPSSDAANAQEPIGREPQQIWPAPSASHVPCRRGRRHSADDKARLERLLNDENADARIGGASGLLYLRRS
jgi:hypothetical protein